ncbi:MAG TPA: pyridoxal phosphate-dependent aminotransferase [Candidatus Acidoferrales bacterium]|nr:pyridoxal phosphate-dependent aminotransferase [Candidatus Acidoferrales bacterium]
MFADRTNWNLAPNRLAEALAQHRAKGKQLLDLTASNPTDCGFRYDTAAILRALSNPAVTVYQPEPRGLATARHAVAEYYGPRGGEVPVEDILLATSTSEAYSFVFRLLCNPGDELLIPAPSYPLFDFLADIQDVKLVRYPLFYDHGWEIDFQAMRQAITSRTRGIIVVHPNNPTGNYLNSSQIKRLNEICSARDMAVIADEVFFDFSLMPERPISFAANRGALTFTMSGLSKIAGLPQMKAAWLITSGPDPWKSQASERLEVIADTYLSPNTPVQVALPSFLEQRHAFQQQLLTRVRSNLAELDRQIAGQESCSRLKIDGGWYAILRVPATRPDEALAVELLESSGVYAHPGHFYDFPREGYLIVSLITPESIFAEAIQRVIAVLNT